MDQINKAFSILDKNKFVISGLIILLIGYSAVVAPNMPEKYIRWIENPIAKIIVFLLIVLVARRNVTIAILLAIGYMISLHRLSKFIVKKAVAKRFIPQPHPTPVPHKTVIKETTGGNVEVPVHPDELASMHDGKPDPSSCTKKVKYNDFPYPKFVNMDPSAYIAKDDIKDVKPYSDKPELAEY